MSNLSENIKKLRKLHNYSQADLAELLDVTPATISRYEKGMGFSIDKLSTLAAFFNRSVDSLISEAPENIIKDPAGAYVSSNMMNVFRLDKPSHDYYGYVRESWSILPEKTNKGGMWGVARITSGEMEPTASPGSILVGEKIREADFEEDGLYLIVLADKSVLFRQVRQVDADMFRLISHNKAFIDRNVSASEVQELYKVQRVLLLKWV